MNVIWIDRDGTLIDEPLDFQVDSLCKIRFKPGVISALKTLIDAGYYLVMVSNQDGLGTDSFPYADFKICQDFILDLLASQGIVFDEIFICPHRSEEGCACRKPQLGLLDDFLQKNRINLQQSWVIGDRESDRLFANQLGVSFLPIQCTQAWPMAVDAILATLRQVSFKRQTKETTLDVALMLDTDTPSEIETPIPFFSHMLDQVAKHGGFYLKLTAIGDTEVDDHHLVEDTAIALGSALKQALSDKRGIGRYGFTLPMDESLASIAIDISGRSFCDFEGHFTREYVGNMATEMVPHFFRSFAEGLNATIHIKTQGDNHHHMIEACFKVLGRALRQATLKVGDALPSTKGVL